MSKLSLRKNCLSGFGRMNRPSLRPRLGAKQTRLCARYPMQEHSHPLKRLYINPKLGADQTARQRTPAPRNKIRTATTLRDDEIRPPKLCYCRRLYPHSQSIVLSDGNALIFQRKLFLRTRKNRLPRPSEICALDFKGGLRGLKICSVSPTIGTYRSIFHRLC